MLKTLEGPLRGGSLDDTKDREMHPCSARRHSLSSETVPKVLREIEVSSMPNLKVPRAIRLFFLTHHKGQFRKKLLLCQEEISLSLLLFVLSV